MATHIFMYINVLTRYLVDFRLCIVECDTTLGIIARWKLEHNIHHYRLAY